MKTEQLSTSDKLYDLLLGKNGSLPCEIDALRVYSRSPQREVDYLSLANLNNRSFLQAFYLLCFNIYPPAQMMEYWEPSIQELDREEFQKKFVESFIQRPDFATKHIRLYNCTILEPAKLGTPRSRFKIKIYCAMKPLYLRLPTGMKAFLKKCFWKLFFV